MVRRRLRDRAPFVAISVLALACGKHDVPVPTTPPGELVVVEVDAAAAADAGIPTLDVAALADAARTAFAPYVITNGDAPPATVYTWTTLEQVQELVRNKVLLTRDVSPVHGAAFYDQYVRMQTASDPIAALLETKAFARARFAWGAPWATVLGWPDETYGEYLVSATLKPEAWVVLLSTSGRAPARAVDMKGKPLVVADVLAHPERIGAVYFVHDDARAGTYSTIAGPFSRAGYREVVLCNESMIARFAVGTATERAAINASVSALEAMLAYVEAAPMRKWDAGELQGWNRTVVRDWSGRRPIGPADPVRFYESALALPSDLYAPEPGRLRALLEKLAALPHVDPTLGLAHEPRARFVAADARVVKPVPPKPKPSAKPKRPMHGTF